MTSTSRVCALLLCSLGLLAAPTVGVASAAQPAPTSPDAVVQNEQAAIRAELAAAGAATAAATKAGFVSKVSEPDGPVYTYGQVRSDQGVNFWFATGSNLTLMSGPAYGARTTTVSVREYIDNVGGYANVSRLARTSLSKQGITASDFVNVSYDRSKTWIRSGSLPPVAFTSDKSRRGFMKDASMSANPAVAASQVAKAKATTFTRTETPDGVLITSTNLDNSYEAEFSINAEGVVTAVNSFESPGQVYLRVELTRVGAGPIPVPVVGVNVNKFQKGIAPAVLKNDRRVAAGLASYIAKTATADAVVNGKSGPTPSDIRSVVAQMSYGLKTKDAPRGAAIYSTSVFGTVVVKVVVRNGQAVVRK